MKTFYLIPLLFLSACSTAPRLTLRPQQPPPLTDDSSVRYPEVLHAYHIGRYADPNDDSLMHEQHVVYRVETGSRWDFRPGTIDGNAFFPAAPPPRDAAFNPSPVNDAVLAEVNAQKLATTQIIMQTRTLSSALAQFQSALSQTKTNLQETARLRATVNEMQKRLDAMAATPDSSPPFSPTNEPADPLSP